MLRIAGQTAGPIGLKFFVDTHGSWTPPCYKLKKIEFFVFNCFFFKIKKKIMNGQRRALQLVQM